jgi:hypothetical protein
VASPYVIRGKELDIVAGVRSPVVLPELKPPKPPIRQLPLPAVLFPGLKKGA